MLRNINEISGYRLQALDGEIGRCQDFLFDDRDGTLRYMVAKTARWLPGRKVLVPIDRLASVHWADRSVEVDMSKEAIESSPEFDPSAPPERRQAGDLMLYLEAPELRNDENRQ